MNRWMFILVFFTTQWMFSQEMSKRTVKLMGSRFEITVVSSSTETTTKYIEEAISEISRIESLISSWDPKSETSLINRNAGIKPVVIAAELFDLIKRSVAISKLTNGAFDISYASLDKIWKFDGSMSEMPSKEAINKSVAHVGFENIILDDKIFSVFLKHKGMKIGFGAIGKGYAADKAKALLISKEVKAGIINASGDMNSWGHHPDGSDWKVAIKNPLNKNKIFSVLPLNNNAVVTSGNYEKNVTLEGKTYTHIIDPRTGYPSSGIISASVFAPSAELADALATSIFVMGVETGLDFINQLKTIECILVDDQGAIHYSNNITPN